MIEFHPTPATRRKDPDLPNVITARLLRYQWPGFRASWLLTSLHDPQAYPYAELVDLYHRRWQIETIYREWKHGLDIQNLRSHTPAGVFKEIYAHLLLSNLVRWVMTDAVEGTELHPIDLSYLAALTQIKNALLQMSRVDSRRLSAIYQQLLADVRPAPIRDVPINLATAATDTFNSQPGYLKVSLGPLGKARPTAGRVSPDAADCSA